MSYDFYVWACYGIAAVVLGVIIAVSLYDMKKQKKRLDDYKDRPNEF